ncbi:MAG TPA: hypothetical protein VHW23_19900, partial [Kofleriaceae bacterium]|nr:hypothetical protein [Kofleriaceae bacterium]
MKTLAVLSLGGMVWAAGCVGSASDADDAGDVSDVDAKAPVAEVSGSDVGASTFDGDAAQTFEDAVAR